VLFLVVRQRWKCEQEREHCNQRHLVNHKSLPSKLSAALRLPRMRKINDEGAARQPPLIAGQCPT